MPKQRFVPGVGPANFPDDMDESAIQAIIAEQAFKNPPTQGTPKVDVSYVSPAGNKVSEEAYKRHSGDIAKLQRDYLPIADAATGFMQGGPVGAGISLALGARETKNNPNRKASDVLASGLSAGAGQGLTQLLLNRLTGGKATAAGELAKGIFAGLGQTAGEYITGQNPDITPAVSQTAGGILAALGQGISNKLGNAPRLLSNKLMQDVMDTGGVTTKDVFLENRGKFATPIRADLVRKLESPRFPTRRVPSTMTPTEKTNQTMVYDEIGNLLKASPLKKKNPATGRMDIYKYSTKNKEASLFPQRLASRIVPSSSNANGKMLWDKMEKTLDSASYDQMRKLATVNLLDKHFDTSSGELQASLLNDLSRWSKNGVLGKVMGDPAKARQVVTDMENLIKAQKAIYKTTPGELSARVAGAAAGGPVAKAYQGIRAIALMRNPGIGTYNKAVPNMYDIARGVVNKPGYYSQSLKWLADHGTTAPASLVRAAVATLTSGGEE